MEIMHIKHLLKLSFRLVKQQRILGWRVKGIFTKTSQEKLMDQMVELQMLPLEKLVLPCRQRTILLGDLQVIF